MAAWGIDKSITVKNCGATEIETTSVNGFPMCGEKTCR